MVGETSKPAGDYMRSDGSCCLRAADATWLEDTIAAKEGEAESRVLRAEKRAADAERRLQQYLGASTELIKPLLRQGKQVQHALAQQSAARGDGSGLWLWCASRSHPHRIGFCSPLRPCRAVQGAGRLFRSGRRAIGPANAAHARSGRG